MNLLCETIIKTLKYLKSNLSGSLARFNKCTTAKLDGPGPGRYRSKNGGMRGNNTQRQCYLLWVNVDGGMTKDISDTQWG